MSQMQENVKKDNNDSLQLLAIEKHLFELSLHDSTAQMLWSIWIIDKKRLTIRMGQTSTTFLTYSNHGAAHSKVILSNIAKLLGTRLSLLGATDTWMLLECAYRHDSGMYITFSEMQEEIESDNFKTQLKEMKRNNNNEISMAAHYLLENEMLLKSSNLKEENWLFWSLKSERNIMLILSEIFRKKHGERSQTAVMDDVKEQVYIEIPLRIWKLIAWICKGHNENRNYILELERFECGLDSEIVHPRFIQMLIRLGDLLDVDNNRFNPYQLYLWGTADMQPLTSRVHQLKHKALEHLYISPNTIEMTARFNCDADDEADEINNKLKKDKNNLSLKYKRERLSEKKIIDAIHREPLLKTKKDGDSQKRKKDIEENEKLLRKACIETYGWNEWLKLDLEFFSTHWGEIVPKEFPGVAPMLGKTEIYWQKLPLDLETFDLKYTISQRRASEIIEGTGLYGNTSLINSSAVKGKYSMDLIFIRELMQNAMDATKLQAYRYLREGRYGDPDDFGNNPKEWTALPVLRVIGDFINHLAVEININYDSYSGSVYIKVVDVGTGIDSKTLQKMSNIGSPRNAELENEISGIPKWLRPNGSFGIGMQSVFGIVQKFEGESGSRIDRKSRNLYFQSAKTDGGIYVIEHPERSTPHMRFGTEISVEITADEQDRIYPFILAKDVFERSVSSIFQQFEENIEIMLGKDIFPFRVNFYIDDVKVSRTKTFPSALSDLYKNTVLDSFYINTHGLLNLSDKKDDPFQLQYYDDELCILVCMSLKPIESMENLIGTTRLYYRGSHVPDVSNTGQLKYPCWNITAYIWNYKTEDTLTINRNSLLPNKINAIYEDFADVVDIAVDKFIDKLSAKESNDSLLMQIKQYCQEADNGDEILNALACAIYIHRLVTETTKGKYDNIVMKCNDLLNDSIFDNIDLQWPSFKIISDKCMKTNLPAIECFRTVLNKQWMLHVSDMFSGNVSILRFFDNREELKLNTLLIDYFSDTLHSRKKKLYMHMMSVLNIDSAVHPFVSIYTLTTQACDYVYVSDTVEKQWIEFIRSYISKEKQGRYIIPGLLKYRDLSVSKVPNDMCQPCINPAGCYLIMPLSNEEIIEIINNNSSVKEMEQAIEDYFDNNSYIEGSSSLDLLISYVIKNRIQVNQSHENGNCRKNNKNSDKNLDKKERDSIKDLYKSLMYYIVGLIDESRVNETSMS